MVHPASASLRRQINPGRVVQRASHQSIGRSSAQLCRLDVKKKFSAKCIMAICRIPPEECRGVRRAMVMDITTLVGLLAAFCTTVSYYPQLKKCWKTGSAGDLFADDVFGPGDWRRALGGLRDS